MILGDGSIIDVRNFGKLLMDKIIILSSTMILPELEGILSVDVEIVCLDNR